MKYIISIIFMIILACSSSSTEAVEGKVKYTKAKNYYFDLNYEEAHVYFLKAYQGSNQAYKKLAAIGLTWTEIKLSSFGNDSLLTEAFNRLDELILQNPTDQDVLYAYALVNYTLKQNLSESLVHLKASLTSREDFKLNTNYSSLHILLLKAQIEFELKNFSDCLITAQTLAINLGISLNLNQSDSDFTIQLAQKIELFSKAF